MLQRLRAKKSHYNVSKWEDEDLQRQRYLKNISDYPNPHRFPAITPIKERANSSNLVRSGPRGMSGVRKDQQSLQGLNMSTNSN